MIEQSRAFALHTLSSEQKDMLSRFKGPDPNAKFENLDWQQGQTGCPILKECVAFVECKLRETYQPGNHSLFVGEIVNGGLVFHAPPLTTLEYGGTYIGKA